MSDYEITDEMRRAATAAKNKAEALGVPCAVAVLEAVAPLIRAQERERCIMACTPHEDECAMDRAVKAECADAIRALKE